MNSPNGSEIHYDLNMTTPFEDDWEFGGIYSEAGNLDRPVAPNQLVVPGIVEINGDKLVWQQERIIEEP
jgi:hypothetical protein